MEKVRSNCARHTLGFLVESLSFLERFSKMFKSLPNHFYAALLMLF